MSLIKDPLHPGAVLKELYLDPLGLSAMALAGHLRVPRTRIERLVKGETRARIPRYASQRPSIRPRLTG